MPGAAGDDALRPYRAYQPALSGPTAKLPLLYNKEQRRNASVA